MKQESKVQIPPGAYLSGFCNPANGPEQHRSCTGSCGLLPCCCGTCQHPQFLTFLAAAGRAA